MHVSLPRPSAGSAVALPHGASQWVPAGIILGLLMFAGTTVLIAQTSMETAAGYEVERLEGLRAAVVRDNQRLEAEVASLKSLDRIDQLAVTQLKMVKPTTYTYITVDMVPPSARGSARARQSSNNQAESSPAEPWWERLLSGLAGQRRAQ